MSHHGNHHKASDTLLFVFWSTVIYVTVGYVIKLIKHYPLYAAVLGSLATVSLIVWGLVINPLFTIQLIGALIGIFIVCTLIVCVPLWLWARFTALPIVQKITQLNRRMRNDH
jgi:hypothetical protein